MSTETNPLAEMSRDEMMSALFAQLVFQSTNAAMMFLGQVPHPETKETIQDFEAARMFIDQLEMLALKTKGNLSAQEDRLLQQSLTHVRLAFVEVVEKKPEQPKTENEPKPETPATEAASIDADEPRKRFTKKY
jgi:hypothetical protein